MDANSALASLGLNGNEIRLYLANLELGTASARDIAQHAGVQRTHFYDLAHRLLARGLMREERRGRSRRFIAADPHALVAMQEERLHDLRDALPELNALRNTSGQRPRVFSYEGPDGIDRINDDTLQYDGEIVAFTTPRFVAADGERLSRDFIRRRVALGKRTRVIGEISPELLRLRAHDADELRETRLLPKERFHSGVEFGVYGNRVFVADYKERFGLVIESSEVADVLRQVFEIVWDSGKIVT